MAKRGSWPPDLRHGPVLVLAVIVAASAPMELTGVILRRSEPGLPIGIGLEVLGRGIKLVEEGDQGFGRSLDPAAQFVDARLVGRGRPAAALSRPLGWALSAHGQPHGSRGRP